jgi:hypothetical protein
LKNGKLSQDILPERNDRSIVLKANYFWFQNIIKQLIKSLEEIFCYLFTHNDNASTMVF